MTPFDPAGYQDPLTIQRVLLHAKTIAVVGLSKNTLRASHFVGFYLRRHGYRGARRWHASRHGGTCRRASATAACA